jgi:hypothetical protein
MTPMKTIDEILKEITLTNQLISAIFDVAGERNFPVKYHLILPRKTFKSDTCKIN